VKEVKTLAVLDGDNRRGRVRESKRLFDAISLRRVMVSGGSWLPEAMIEAGVPATLGGHPKPAINRHLKTGN
jgi:hypothetical protein